VQKKGKKCKKNENYIITEGSATRLEIFICNMNFFFFFFFFFFISLPLKGNKGKQKDQIIFQKLMTINISIIQKITKPSFNSAEEKSILKY